ncbi:hypothetical protein TUM12370_25980 [Salmonella enterica subsp. enterica serovar Choleraesuis]|nr:hypothetical protein TUM12370_25980 [Salmonella enterica subsp. enterica serovar Choleraesuis]
MSDYVYDHAVIRQLQVLNGELKNYLQMRKAKGYMHEAETARLRNALFALNADYQEVRWPLASQMNRAQFMGLQDAMHAVNATAVCLLSGSHDCPSYVSVDVPRLEACLALLQEGMDVALGAENHLVAG